MTTEITNVSESKLSRRIQVNYSFYEQTLINYQKAAILPQIAINIHTGKSVIYDNQNGCATQIVSILNNKKIINIMVLALTQSGKTGTMLALIRNYLLSKGVRDKYINETLSDIKENNEDQDFFSAIKICKKKRIGPARDENNRPLFMKKDLGILARSGFDFDTSKRVLDIEKDEYLKIINLL